MAGFRRVLSLALLLLPAAVSFAGEPVWVSTDLDWHGGYPKMATGIDGDIWIVMETTSSKVVANHLSNDGSTHSTSFPSPGASHATGISVDSSGSPHVMTIESYGTPAVTHLIHYFLLNEVWEREETGLNSVNNSYFKIDTRDVIHVASAVESISPSYSVIYSSRGSTGWSHSGPVVTHTDRLAPSVEISQNGSPVIAVNMTFSLSAQVRLYLRSTLGWELIKSIVVPSAFYYQTPRIHVDDLDRIHLSWVGTPLNYALLSMSGNYFPGYPATIGIPTTTTEGFYCNPGVAFDSFHGPHFAFGHSYALRDSVHYNYSEGVDFCGDLTLMQNNLPVLIFEKINFSHDSPFVIATKADQPLPPLHIDKTATSLSWLFEGSTFTVPIGHRLIRSSTGEDISGLLATGVTSFVQSGLSPNQRESVVLRRQYLGGLFIDSVPGTATYTLAVPPENLFLNRSGSNTLSLQWTLGANSPGTSHRARLFPISGGSILVDTTETIAVFPSLDPSVPYAVTLSAVNGNGIETFVSSLTAISSSAEAARFSFSLSDGLAVLIDLGPPSSGAGLVVSASSASTFPSGPVAFGDFLPLGVGFSVPASQLTASSRSVLITLQYPDGRLDSSETLTLARFDVDRNHWVPLATRSNPFDRTLTASTRGFGLFQVMARGAPTIGVGGARVFPNPFRPVLHRTLNVQDVPPGTSVKIRTDSGRLIRELSSDTDTIDWDGMDSQGRPAHSGVYSLDVESGRERRRLRFILEQ